MGAYRGRWRYPHREVSIVTAAVHSSPSAIPTPDCAEMRRALDALHGPDYIIEIRALHTTRRRTDAGYFDFEHRPKLIEEAERLNKARANVYINLNELNPQVLARAANRVHEFASITTSDRDIRRRRWLLVDLDPCRPSGVASTDAQLEAARQRGRDCYALLRRQAWPEPLVAESGSGLHLLYPIDLANDKESAEMLKGALSGLAQRLDDEHVTVDVSVHNAARIVRFYGTINFKGDATPATPWRQARLRSKGAV